MLKKVYRNEKSKLKKKILLKQKKILNYQKELEFVNPKFYNAVIWLVVCAIFFAIALTISIHSTTHGLMDTGLEKSFTQK